MKRICLIIISDNIPLPDTQRDIDLTVNLDVPFVSYD